MSKNPRINVTFDEREAAMIATLAEKESKSLAGLVRELAMEAIELREDVYLSKLANEIDKNDAKIYTHKDAWK